VKDLAIGIDIGTTLTKGVVIDAAGKILAEAGREATLISRHPGWAEEEPEQWWQNVLELLKEFASSGLDPDRIAAIGVSGMVPAMVMIDAEGSPIRPSIQQNDARAGAEVEELAERFGQDAFFAQTGGSINQQVVAPKMRWLEKHEPDAVANLATLFGSYDFINYRLTGERTVEHNWALESGLLDVQTGDWSTDLLSLAGVHRHQLGRIVDSSEVIGGLTEQVAKETGLLAGTPVVGGAADHVASAYVTTAYADGDLVVKFGGAGDILYSQANLVTDPRLFIDYHMVPGLTYLNGCMATSGSLLKWFVQNFASDATAAAESEGRNVYAWLDDRAASIPAGSDGVVVLPYFLGEKTPLHDPNARGTILGLALHHNRNHLYRALLEAVAFGFRHHVDVLNERGLPVTRVLAADGGAASDLWMQITADVLNRPVQRLDRHPGSSLGAAMAAGIGVGLFDNWSEVERFVELSDAFEPIPAHVDVLNRNYGVYRETYERLKDLYPQLSTPLEESA